METFTYTCVTLRDFCEYAEWDYDEVLEGLLNSDISYGTNDDTLVRPDTLANIMEYDFPKNVDADILISIGS